MFAIRRTLIFSINRLCHTKNKVEIDWKVIKHKSKVPAHPVDTTNSFKAPDEKISISPEQIALLERLSLVDLDSKEALKTLEDSINFASKILSIDTENVEPMYTPLEDQSLTLREDEVTDGNIQEDVLKNAVLTEEEYFVAPPGNIPLEQEDKKF